MSATAIIPARMAATRFPDKPLADLNGLPMVMHCYYRAQLAKLIDEVVITTCDLVIAEVARSYGAAVVMTSDVHTNAVDRTAEAVRNLQTAGHPNLETIVLVQGDEPTLNPETLDLLVSTINRDPGIEILNVMVPFSCLDDYLDPNNPKVAVGSTGDALYMSREAIPSAWKAWDATITHMQTGLFAFRPEALEWFSTTARTELEKSESIDMLRMLYHGHPVRMMVVNEPSVGVDTPEDLARVRDMLAVDPWVARYPGHLDVTAVR